ncbi:uncharacterized protein LOC111264847 [Varroa jacobsoni]|nr:uncharacterized protein LOC111264847 [Varroa jacobsoni]XP_022696801.1 uncharacterized protein LOC111264847 [Varroa jacobsoni]XP_022696808.1 uncharacterized protein LOC111264847 [Varroa jacobsoni]
MEDNPALTIDTPYKGISGISSDSSSEISENTEPINPITESVPPAKSLKMRMLDQVNVPVLPFGGNRFAELSFKVQPNGHTRMILNEIMAIIREEAMPPNESIDVAEGDKVTPGTSNLQYTGFSRDRQLMMPEIFAEKRTSAEPYLSMLSQSRNGIPHNAIHNTSVITDVFHSGEKILMPDAPTIIMQVPPPATPVARFALRKIPSNINIPSVYDILNPEERKQNNGFTSVIDNVSGRAIVTLPLLPLRALSPIQQSYYRYNRIQPFSPLQVSQNGSFQPSKPQIPSLYPGQFQSAAYLPPPASGYERLFPQSYPTPQGSIFYINTTR